MSPRSSSVSQNLSKELYRTLPEIKDEEFLPHCDVIMLRVLLADAEYGDLENVADGDDLKTVRGRAIGALPRGLVRHDSVQNRELFVREQRRRIIRLLTMLLVGLRERGWGTPDMMSSWNTRLTPEQCAEVEAAGTKLAVNEIDDEECRRLCLAAGLTPSETEDWIDAIVEGPEGE